MVYDTLKLYEEKIKTAEELIRNKDIYHAIEAYKSAQDIFKKVYYLVTPQVRNENYSSDNSEYFNYIYLLNL